MARRCPGTRSVAATVGIPDGLAAAVRREIEGSDLPWDAAVAAIVSRRSPKGSALADPWPRGVTRPGAEGEYGYFIASLRLDDVRVSAVDQPPRADRLPRYPDGAAGEERAGRRGG